MFWLYVCMYVCMYVCVPCVCLVPMKVRKCISTIVSMLETEPRSSPGATGAVNSGALSPAPWRYVNSPQIGTGCKYGSFDMYCGMGKHPGLYHKHYILSYILAKNLRPWSKKHLGSIFSYSQIFSIFIVYKLILKN